MRMHYKGRHGSRWFALSHPVVLGPYYELSVNSSEFRDDLLPLCACWRVHVMTVGSAVFDAQQEKNLCAPHFGFVMEQTLGHVTHYRNMRNSIDADQSINAAWYPLSFEPDGKLENFPLLRSNWSLRSSRRAWRALSRDRAGERYDALFFHTQITTLLSARLMRRVPSVVSLDATPMNYDAVGTAYGHRQAGGVAERLKRDLTVRSLHAARALVAFSDWVRRSLLDDYGVPEERIHVIPPGVDLTRWPAPTGRLKNGAHGSEPFRLLFVGGDFERKGGPLLLEVFRRFLRDTCTLHLVTKSDLSEEKGVRVYRGFGPNEPGLQALYERCDALVLPTQADTFSHVALEAMASGLPVVTCPVGGIPEIVQPGETGFLVPPNDAGALLRAIRVLLNDRERSVSMGLRGRALVEQRFDSATNVRAIVKIMTALAVG